jgi:hypothetical protein
VITTSLLTEHQNNKIKALQECTVGIMMDGMFLLSLINCLSANLSCFILLQHALRKKDGKLPFYTFSTDDIGIINTTDEKSSYYLGKLQNSGHNYIKMIDTYGPALVGVKQWEQQRGSTLLSDILTPSDQAFALLAFLNYIDPRQQTNEQDADPVSGD